MPPEKSAADLIVEAYDKALNELIVLQNRVEAAIVEARRQLQKARREALKELHQKNDSKVGPGF